MRLLVIEDEKRLADSLKKNLEGEGFTVEVSLDGEEGYGLAAVEEFDLIILDVHLPKMDGLRVAQKLRGEKVATPILMLTARDSTDDKIEGLNHGADDYLVKPFDFAELLALIRALLRRVPLEASLTLEVGNLILNSQTRIVKRRGREIGLSAKEYALLEYLMRHHGQIITHSAILDHVWGSEVDPFSNVVDVYMGYLRAKIDKAFPAEKPLIETVKGLGYRIG